MEAKKLKELTKLFLVLIITSIYFYSCLLKPKPMFEYYEIEMLAYEEELGVPSRYYDLDFFCKGNSDSVVKLQYRELKEIYKNQFSNLDYNDYLTKLLNQKITINCNGKNFVKLNNAIYEKYKSNNFDNFLNYYCKNTNNSYKLTKKLSQDELNTFSYILFINGYFVTFDDYIGIYYITHKKDIFPCDSVSN